MHQPEMKMLGDLDQEDYLAVITLIRALYLKTVYKREANNERKRRGLRSEFQAPAISG